MVQQRFDIFIKVIDFPGFSEVFAAGIKAFMYDHSHYREHVLNENYNYDNNDIKDVILNSDIIINVYRNTDDQFKL